MVLRTVVLKMGLKDGRTENGSSQGNNLALTVSCVPRSLDSGASDNRLLQSPRLRSPVPHVKEGGTRPSNTTAHTALRAKRVKLKTV